MSMAISSPANSQAKQGAIYTRHDTPSKPSHLIPSVNASFATMTTSPVRRKRGTGIGNVQLVTTVPKTDKQLVVDLAEQLGLSQSEAMEVILKHLRTELAHDGIPVWFDRNQLPEALPIAKAS